MSNVHSVTVTKRAAPVIELEIRGNRCNIGKSKVLELIHRTLKANGYHNIVRMNQDGDQKYLASLHDEELRHDPAHDVPTITLLDNNRKPQEKHQ